MNFFGIGLPELAVIAAIGLLVFGPKRLPELGKTLGKTLKGFQSASSEFEKEFRSAIATGDTAEAEPKVMAAQPVAAEPVVAEVAAPEVAAAEPFAEVPATEAPQPSDAPPA